MNPPYLKIAERSAMLFAAKGYRMRISPELKDEIRRYYGADNRGLEALLTRAKGLSA